VRTARFLVSDKDDGGRLYGFESSTQFRHQGPKIPEPIGSRSKNDDRHRERSQILLRGQVFHRRPATGWFEMTFAGSNPLSPATESGGLGSLCDPHSLLMRVARDRSTVDSVSITHGAAPARGRARGRRNRCAGPVRSSTCAGSVANAAPRSSTGRPPPATRQPRS
jgi:hypothetical protein